MGNGIRPGKMPAALAEGLEYYDNWLVAAAFALYLRAFRDRPGLARACKWAFQAGGAAIAIWACVEMASLPSFSPLLMRFAQGVVGSNLGGLERASSAALLMLLLAYGLGSLLSFNKSLYVMDAAAVLTASLVIVRPSFAFLAFVSDKAEGVLFCSAVAVAWIAHRLVLGSLAVFYKRAVRIDLTDERGGRLG